MLKKCLKYDLKAVWPIWWIVALAVLAAGLIGCVCIRGLIEISNYTLTHDSTVFTVVGGITLGLVGGIAGFAQIAFLTVSPILVYVHFYRNFFTDEGYLTFTLPVSRKTLYFSKTLNGMIWMAATIGVVLLVVLVGLCICPSTLAIDSIWTGTPLENPMLVVGPFNLIAFKTIGDGFTAMWEDVGAWLIVYILEALTALVLFILFENGLIQMCITIGCVIAKKLKLLASIGIYYGVTSAISLVGELIIMFGIASMVPGFALLAQNLSESAAYGLLALILLLACVIIAIFGTIVHFIALGNIERRLNLA